MSKFVAMNNLSHNWISWVWIPERNAGKGEWDFAELYDTPVEECHVSGEEMKQIISESIPGEWPDSIIPVWFSVDKVV